jgi:hypothetical protein
MPLVVAGLAVFLILVITRELLAILVGVKEGSRMIKNRKTVSSALEVFLAVGTGYLAGSLPA